VFFFKSKNKAAKKAKPAAVKKPPMSEAERDRAGILMMIRGMRKKISPDVLLAAERAAFSQIGEEAPDPPENDASRLFKMAMKNNGARRAEILELVERRVNKRLH
jgi:hypothetical protein